MTPIIHRIVLGLLLLVGLTTAPAAAADDCGSRVEPNQVPDILQLQKMGLYDTAVQERYILYVPLTIHIVRLDNGNGGIGQADVDATIVAANGYWSGSGMQFFQSGPTLYINSTNFYYNINTQAEIHALRNTASVGNTVNCYFTDTLMSEEGGLCGQATFTTTGGSQGVAMANSCTAPEYPTTFGHELGHFFDLFHTHETSMGQECPNGSNCASAGDLVCDTVADPTLETDSGDPDYNVDTSDCVYFGTTMACGQAFNPDTTNLMSYGTTCRTHFTYGQESRALATLVNLRSNLVNPPQLNVTWVDFGYGGASNGSFNQPYNNLATAVAAVSVGGRIVMKTSSAYQTLTISKACILDSFRGTATVGQ